MKNVVQLKMGRIAAGWDQETLAKKSGVGVATIRRMEDDFSSVRDESKDKVKAALVKAGVRFKDDGCVCPPEK